MLLNDEIVSRLYNIDVSINQSLYPKLNSMSKTIKASVSIMLQKVKIVLLKNKIRKMEHSAYLNLFERMELRDDLILLNQLEENQQMHAGLLSLQ